MPLLDVGGRGERCVVGGGCLWRCIALGGVALGAGAGGASEGAAFGVSVHAPGDAALDAGNATLAARALSK